MTTLLLVDDTDSDRAIVRSLLAGNSDVTIIEARHGGEGIEVLKSVPVDLVLTDLRMPDVDGMELVSWAKQNIPTLPIVLMTACGSEQIAFEALLSGADGYLPKTHLHSHLIETLTQFHGRISRERNGAAVVRSTIEHRLNFRLRTATDWIPGLVYEISQFAIQAGVCEIKDEYRVGVAIEEALRNSVIHGNLGISSALREKDGHLYEKAIAAREADEKYHAREISVTVTSDSRGVDIVIEDQGAGFDVASLPDPTDPENLLKASGRGVLLMRAFVDDVQYNEKGNRVLLRLERRERSDTALADDSSAEDDAEENAQPGQTSRCSDNTAPVVAEVPAD